MKLLIASLSARGARREARGGFPPSLKRTASSLVSAFTLMEIMIVVAILGLVAAMGLPNLMKALEKEGMRKAVSDVQDVFFSARERAILTQQKVAVLILPQERKFAVEGGGAGPSHSGRVSSATLPDGIEMAMLDIFRQDYAESDWAKIFFNSDGTCDEAVIVLIGKGERRKITLDFATGLPDVTDVIQ